MSERRRLEEDEDIGTLQTLRLLLRAVRYIEPFKRRFAVKFGLLMTSMIPMLILPWPVKIIVDNVVEARPVGDPIRAYPFFVTDFMRMLEGLTTTEILFVVVGCQLLLFLVIGAFGTGGEQSDRADSRLASGYDTATRTENEANEGWSFVGGLLGLFDFRWTMRLTEDFNHHYRSKLFERIQTLPMVAFDDERIGDAVYRVMYDTPSITNAVYRMLLTPVAAPIHILLCVFIIWATFGDQPTLVLCALGFLPVSFLGTFPFLGAMRRASGRSRKAGATATSTAEEGMTNILAVQSLGGEDRQSERYDRDSWSSFSRFRRVFLVSAGAIVFTAIPGVALAGYALLTAIDLVIAGEISRGDFSLLITYFFHIVFSAADLGSLWFGLQDTAAGLHRVFFLMDLPGELDHEDAQELGPIRGEVRIEGVDYDYPDGTPALRDVSLSAGVGQVIALAGPAGAGKTSLAYLLPRFISPTRGHVNIDGIDIERVSLDSLRSQVSFVFQETILFDATIEENIRMGRPDATETEIRMAARRAGADEFIRKLPQGYATPLGRAGGKLSVGQKQRLSIARALVRDAPILILDEPTSALDPKTERGLVETLREVSRGRFVFVIAHRLSTIRAADQILFLEEGRIVERGTHEELMASGGPYRRFTDMQTVGVA